jgi:hypothetical protein
MMASLIPGRRLNGMSQMTANDSFGGNHKIITHPGKSGNV